MSSIDSDTILPSIGNTLGVIQNSNSVSVFLFGILTLQVYYYFKHHSGDGPYIKGLTGVIWLLELVYTIGILHIGYWSAIELGSLSTLLSASGRIWSINVFFAACALVDTVVQLFYGLWLNLVTKRWEITVICWTLTLAQIGISIPMMVSADTSLLGVVFGNPHVRALLLSLNAARFAMDSIVSVALCYYLIKTEGENRLGLGKWLLLFIEAGIFSGVLQFVILGLTIWSTHNFIWLGLFFIRAKVLANSLLVALNSRHLWKTGLPLIDLGKKPFFPFLPQSSKMNDLKVLDIRVETLSQGSSSSSFNNEQVSIMNGEAGKLAFGV